MSLLKHNERVIVGAVAALADGNPFLPEWVELERRALGAAFTGGGPVWHADADVATAGPNVAKLRELVERRFEGKVIAATNRNLDDEIATGRFRRDLYYRICADLIRTPTLREQLADAPGDLRTLILIVARRAVGDDAEEGTRLAAEVERWVLEHLGEDYPWPGNVRELEQCVRNVLIRGVYHPRHVDRDDAGELADTMRRGTLTAEDLLQRYCALVYAQTRSYQETARRLGLDRRTVKAKVDAQAGGDNGADDGSAD